MLKLADKLGRYLENAFLSILLLGMIVLGSMQIGLRWSGEGSLAWGDEAIRLMVLWIAMIAGIAAAREDKHISIDVLARILPPTGKAITATIVDIFCLCVCAVLAWYSYAMLQFAIEGGEILLGGLPAWWFQSILPIGFGLISWRYLVWTIKRFRYLFLVAKESGGSN
ncbi:MAG: TRAP transporter small permease [Gammaproteobacteria bacterium]